MRRTWPAMTQLRQGICLTICCGVTAQVFTLTSRISGTNSICNIFLTGITNTIQDYAFKLYTMSSITNSMEVGATPPTITLIGSEFAS